MFYREQVKEEETNTEDDIKYGKSPTCFEVHEKWQLGCDEKSCRNWIDYDGDSNCAIVCARKNPNGLSLREVADRMGVSFPRISQVEHGTFEKLRSLGVLNEFENE
jgi:hypothetical protein